MSYFDYWFENIVSTADLITSPDLLNRAWIHQDKTITSAYDFDELMEQLFGDLHLQEHIHQFKNELREKGALEAFTAFAQALSILEMTVKSDPHIRDPKNLLVFPAWTEIKGLAKQITQLPSAQEWLSSTEPERVLAHRNTETDANNPTGEITPERS